MGQVSETDSYRRKLVDRKNTTIQIGENKMKTAVTNNTKGVATFSKDESLPSLPLPELRDTLDKYLDSIKPFVTKLEYLKSEKIVADFENGIGKMLHFHLSQKAAREKNWVNILKLFAFFLR
jgi:hypothetical protein